MCILYDKDYLSVIHHLLLCTPSLFFLLCDDMNHPNKCKYKFHKHEKRLYLPIRKFCFKWKFYQRFLASKERLEFIAVAVFIWPKSIVI